MGTQDKYGDEVALMVIQLHNSNERCEEEVKRWLKQNIDQDYLPKEIRFVKEMALTANSKVDKIRLRQLIG